MRILFCCEFYTPSVGGVQEVIKQIAERLVLRGHDVTVATTKLLNRDFDELNGVKIKGFEVSGNLVHGMVGDVEAYRRFVISGNFDAIIIKAAQQWTFDALWSVLPQIKAHKVFIPCGFSRFYEPSFANYFQIMPNILRQFDHLIFYASDYRDINFAREHGLTSISVIPNGASEIEFSVEPDPLFRERYGIGKEDFLCLTVGSFTGMKGHFEVASAFEKAKFEGPATLILNGNKISNSVKATLKTRAKGYIKSGLQGLNIIKEGPWLDIAKKVNAQAGNKKILITDLPRPELVQAFIAADLFVFASNIEYSPLVLFESAAAGTPFLSVPVGNAEEIARWTGGGVICPASRDERGYTHVDPVVLAEHMSKLAKDKSYLSSLGRTGKKNWSEKFTWDKIAMEYEKVLIS
ncbi:MAG: glycosyltransferase family 4 protein [Firmicutes bacterium]|nr:glycosyltransferase family 4 protein [Bacillota bacterium]